MNTTIHNNQLRGGFNMKHLGLVALIITVFFSSTVCAYTLVEENPVTADGIMLSIKHYENPGAQPVILQHGVVQNSNCWDLPVAGHSFAIYLADLGYDVWVPSYRGHGQDGFVSEGEPGNDWTIDKFVVYDIPAIVDYVIDYTGKKPLWVGHSMGGMTVYGYLQGAEYQYVVVDNDWDWSCFCYRDVYDWRIGTNSTLRTERNSNKLAGAITVNSPARMKWKHDVSIANFWYYDYYDYNLLVQTFSELDAVRAALKAMDPVPLQEIVDFVLGDIRSLPYVGNTLADLLEWTFGNVGDSFVCSQFWNPDNMTVDLVDAVIDHTLDNTSSNVLLQFMQSANAKNFQEFDYDDPDRSPYVYSEHYGDITLPIMVVSSEKDKMACNDVVYADGFLQIGSNDKTYHDFANFGHDDVCLGNNASTVVFPELENWLALHSPSSDTAGMK
ncbi:alpha/beta hydrolase [candidate division CSSED10-310 bacterium]|uniref:Alpha/beta hydrolase n=1 Tax=candidate division CSSED10-310 bacterium TaxID=2855610 RepID=A0ABV6YU82_UNCC1